MAAGDVKRKKAVRSSQHLAFSTQPKPGAPTAMDAGEAYATPVSCILMIVILDWFWSLMKNILPSLAFALLLAALLAPPPMLAQGSSSLLSREGHFPSRAYNNPASFSG